MEDKIDKSGSDIAAAAAEAAVVNAKIDYLKLLTMTLLNELSVLTEDRRQRAKHRIDLRAEVQRFESDLISMALQLTRGQQRPAARLLGTNATTLHAKLKRLKIENAHDEQETFPLTPSSEIGLIRDGDPPLTFAEAMGRYEVGLIRNALLHTGGNQTKAARLLKLPVTTLNSKIKKLKIEIPHYSASSTTDFTYQPTGFTSKVDNA